MKKTISIYLSVMVCMYSCGNSSVQSNNSELEKNKTAMKKVLESFETGNTDDLKNYVAENTVNHNPDPMISTTGLQGVKDAVTLTKTAMPDVKITILSIVAENDYVVAHFNMKGTNTGRMGGIGATNKTLDVNGVDIVRFENGKGVERWGYYEEAKMMHQLGMMP